MQMQAPLSKILATFIYGTYVYSKLCVCLIGAVLTVHSLSTVRHFVMAAVQ